MTTVQSTVQRLKSSLLSPPGFRIPFKSSQSKTSLPSSSTSAPPWPWPPCWPWGYWGRPGPGPGPHIYFIVCTFQIGRTAADTEKVKICLFKTFIVCWAEQDAKALWRKNYQIWREIFLKSWTPRCSWSSFFLSLPTAVPRPNKAHMNMISKVFKIIRICWYVVIMPHIYQQDGF